MAGSFGRTPSRAGRGHDAEKVGSRFFADRAMGDDGCPETRIGEHIKPQSNGCWLYEDGSQSAYGSVWTGYEYMKAHRYVYDLLVGPIPEGHVLHHTCATPRCVNPAHLEPMKNGDHVAHHAALRRSA